MRSAWVAVALSAGCGRIGFAVQADGDQPMDGADVAADACAFGPWSTPTRIAVVNSTNDDYSPSLTDDGLDLFFMSDRPGLGTFDIYEATRTSVTAAFGPPTLVAALSTPQVDEGVHISPDGLTVYYCTEIGGTCPLLRASRQTRSTPFSAPEQLGIQDGWGPFPTRDGRELYYTTRGTTDQIWRATVAGTAVVNPMPVAELNPANHAQGFPTLTADGLTIYFQSDLREAAPGDIFRATRPSIDMPFGTPILDDELSAPGLDSDPDLSNGDRTMMFSSIREGDVDLFISTRACQ